MLLLVAFLHLSLTSTTVLFIGVSSVHRPSQLITRREELYNGQIQYNAIYIDDMSDWTSLTLTVSLLTFKKSR